MQSFFRARRRFVIKADMYTNLNLALITIGLVRYFKLNSDFSQMFRTKSSLNFFFPFPAGMSVHRECIRWRWSSLTILFWCCTYILFSAGFFWTSVNVPCHLSWACLLNIGEQGKKRIGPFMCKRRKSFHCASVCQPRGIFYWHFIVSSFWRSVFQRLPVLHYSELLMWRGRFLNAAFTNSREFSLVSSSCSFPFIWRVNVYLSWRT